VDGDKANKNLNEENSNRISSKQKGNQSLKNDNNCGLEDNKMMNDDQKTGIENKNNYSAERTKVNSAEKNQDRS